MANPAVVYIRKEARYVRGPVGGVIAIWAVIMTWCLVRLVAHPTQHAGVAVFWWTVALGVILGVQRRTAMSWIAPLVAWAFAWLPIWIAFIVRSGWWPGFVYGGLAASFGWIVFFVETGAILFAVSAVVRFALRPFRRRRDVVIIDPKRY